MSRSFILFCVVLLLGVGVVSAHANLIQADPSPNTVIAQSPEEIRLWFTEPLEPDFSSIRVRDRDGNLLDLPSSSVDTADPRQMVLRPNRILSDGLYTVVYRVVSAADGHSNVGSFAFIIGQDALGFGSTSAEVETIPFQDSAIRWLNIASLALLVGALSFKLFVWEQSNPSLALPASGEGNEQFSLDTAIAEEEKDHLAHHFSPVNGGGQAGVSDVGWYLDVTVWVGWVLVGVMGEMLLLLQYALATDSPLFTRLDGVFLDQLISGTRFGQLWLIRMALWMGMGFALYFARSDRWFSPVALVVGTALLLTNSLFSHANAAKDQILSVGADWLHMSAMAAWIGGLIAFAIVIALLRKRSPTGLMAVLVGHFTQFARIAVIALVATGLYANWLQVGSLDGLLTTLYGKTLLLKLILLLPVMLIAFINMRYTSRGLQTGQALWTGRLSGLVGAEIALTLGILAAVGAMTSIAPARATLDLRASIPVPVEPAPITQTLTADDLTLTLVITPGWVGDNLFTLTVVGADGLPATAINRIRMRFESQEQNTGESELRPTKVGDGVYVINGSNLSLTGVWRIRTMVEREGVFDALADFMPQMALAPVPVQPTPVDPNAPLPNRVWALVSLGVVALGAGGYFLNERRTQKPYLAGALALALAVLGLFALFTAIINLNS